MSYKTDFKDAIGSSLDEVALSRDQVVTICSNLGASYTRIHKEIPRIFGEDVGVNPKNYMIFKDDGVYLGTNVWNYLKNLEAKGRLKVTLERRGIHNFNDIIENRYHQKSTIRSLASGRRIGRVHLSEGF